VLHDIIGDLRTSVRQLARTPAFTVSAVAVLALGIGLNAAVLGLSHALVFAGRPFADPSQLVQLYSRHPAEVASFRAFAFGAYQLVDERHDVFSGVTAHTLGTVGVREGSGNARRTFAGYVAANYFEVLGVPVARGRGFTVEEGRPGGHALVAVVTHAYWLRTGARADLVGSHVLVNEQDVTIVGVTPPGFTGTMMAFGPELFLPFGAYDTLRSDSFESRRRALVDPDAFELFLVGRLLPGLSSEVATARLATTAAAMAESLPAQYRGRELIVAPLPRFGTSTSPSDESAIVTVAIVFLGMTGAVLLIVCLNLASVLLARGQTRRREFAIRLALGGGRLRIVRQLLLEGVLLGLAAALGGVLIAAPAIDAFLGTLLARLPIALALDVGTRPAVVGGAVVFGVVAALLFALGPALSHVRRQTLSDLKHQVGDEAPTRRRWLKSRLVTVQIALSVALLVAAGLFVRLARDGMAVDFGAPVEAVVIADVDASLAGYDEARAVPLYAAIEQRLTALPGVESAAIALTVPFGPIHLGYDVRRAGTLPAPGSRPATPEAGKAFEATWNAVGAAYPRTMGQTLLRGRFFTEAEAQRPGALRVAIVDEILARQLWPDGDAVGQSIQIGDDPSAAEARGPDAVEIVGIVSPLQDDMFSRLDEGTVYVPFAQGYRSGVHFQVRPRPGTGAGLLAEVRREVGAAAPGLPIFGVTTFGAHLSSSIEFWGMRTLAAVTTSVGAFAAFIALVGVYGAKAYAVSRRSREIGVRLAVGATPASVRWMILAEALRVGVVGVGAGSVLGLAVGRALDAVFAEVVAVDAWVSTLAPVLFLLACAVAAWVPARRASLVDPATILRAE
jgi:predicted permease